MGKPVVNVVALIDAENLSANLLDEIKVRTERLGSPKRYYAVAKRPPSPSAKAWAQANPNLLKKSFTVLEADDHLITLLTQLPAPDQTDFLVCTNDVELRERARSTGKKVGRAIHFFP